MTLALRLLAAAVLFGGMLVWWAVTVLALMVAWLAVAVAFSVGAGVCRRVRAGSGGLARGDG